jgi:hypothetical protein
MQVTPDVSIGNRFHPPGLDKSFQVDKGNAHVPPDVVESDPTLRDQAPDKPDRRVK